MPSGGVRARSFMLALCAALCGVGATGCSTKPPTFRVVDIAIGTSTPEATVLEVILEGRNENKEPLPLYEIQYTMAIDGDAVATASRSPQATIPSHGVQAFHIPVTVPVSVVSPDHLAIGEYRISGSVTYELPGTIAQLFFDSNIRRPSQGFSESGSFEVDRPVEIVVPEPSPQPASPTTTPSTPPTPPVQETPPAQ